MRQTHSRNFPGKNAANQFYAVILAKLSRNAGCGGGIRRAASNAREAVSTKASAKRGPTICKPIGRPLSETPHNMDAAGWPVRLNGTVKGTAWRQRSNSGE